MNSRAIAAFAVILLPACARGPRTEAADLSAAERIGIADTIRALSDSIIVAGERKDTTAMTARFADGPDVAFGGAGGMVLSTRQLRHNIGVGHQGVNTQEFEIVEQRIAVLGRDAAVTTGWGNFTAVDTSGATERGLQAFTFAWQRRDDAWWVVQAHFSSQLVELRAPPGRSAAPARRP